MALVIIATVVASAAVTADTAYKLKEYYTSYKKKEKSKRVQILHTVQSLPNFEFSDPIDK